jgi:hypothetical protein
MASGLSVAALLVNAQVLPQRAELMAEDGLDFGRFGWSVALSGDVAVVGATGDDEWGTAVVGASNHAELGTFSGAAYAFVRDGTAWTQRSKLLADDGATDDLLGWSVALEGNTAVIGAPYDDDSGDASGSAYLFTRNGAAWGPRGKRHADDGGGDENFGYSIGMSGGAVIVGAFFHGHLKIPFPANRRWGAAYVLSAPRTVPIAITLLLGEDADP